jgi:hypothetical protein
MRQRNGIAQKTTRSHSKLSRPYNLISCCLFYDTVSKGKKVKLSPCLLIKYHVIKKYGEVEVYL